MSKDKKQSTKSARLSGPFKDSMVELLCREALAVSPGLTRTQLQRVFSHCYHAVRSDTKSKMFNNAKLAADRKFRESDLLGTIEVDTNERPRKK